MSNFAKDTTVSVEKTKAEIEATVNKYGAHGFISGWEGNQAMIAFKIKDRSLRFVLPLPDRSEKRFAEAKYRNRTWPVKRTPEQAYAAWEQACRQLWRALLLTIKAKLEAVDSKIATFDEEFLAYIVVADGFTVGQRLMAQGQLSQESIGGKLPPLLPGPAN